MSVRRRASGRVHYNYFRDYDPATDRYAQADPIGLNGGSFSTYLYANGNSISQIDPRGLFQLGVVEAWSEVESFPERREGGQGGLTTPYIKDVQCTCEGSGTCWRLSSCRAFLVIEVQILAGMPGPKDRFMRHAEGEHVKDLMDGLDLIQEWGDIREQRLKAMTFSGKNECESAAANAMKSTLQRAANAVARSSGDRYDHGRHTWHDWYYTHPPF